MYLNQNTHSRGQRGEEGVAGSSIKRLLIKCGSGESEVSAMGSAGTRDTAASAMKGLSLSGPELMGSSDDDSQAASCRNEAPACPPHDRPPTYWAPHTPGPRGPFP